MGKKKTLIKTSKKEIRKIVDRNLESLLINIEPGIGKKKIKSKVKRAGKILAKGINISILKEHIPEIKEISSTV